MSWAAVIIGGSALVGGIASSAMSADAAEEQAEAYGSSQAMQLRFLREVRADIADAVENGLIDLDTGYNMAIKSIQPLSQLGALADYQELLQNPEAVMNRPGIQYQYGQGIEALQSAYSRSSGGGLSGASMKAATEYGQNFAASALDRELARLSPLVDIETGALTNMANIYQNQGQSKSNLRISGATGSGNITNAASQSIAGSMNQAGEAAASSTVNQANILNEVLSQLGLLGGYKMNSSLFKGQGD